MLTDKQREARRSHIGGSEVATIMGLNPYATPYSVWLEKMDMVKPDKGSKATEYGHRFENAILDHAEESIGKLERQVAVKAAGVPLCTLLDGRNEEGYAADAKTTGLSGPVQGYWGADLSSEVPLVYQIQMTAQIVCTEKEMAYLFALIGGRGIAEFHINRCEKSCDQIKRFVNDWWENHVVKQAPPADEIDKENAAKHLAVFKRIIRQPKSSVDLNGDVLELIEAREKAKEYAKLANATVDFYDANLLQRLGMCEAGNLPDGRTVTYLETKRKGYTVEETSYRTIRIKKASK